MPSGDSCWVPFPIAPMLFHLPVLEAQRQNVSVRSGVHQQQLLCLNDVH